MPSRDNVNSRILVLFSYSNPDLEVDNDPYCPRVGKFEGVVEGMIDFMKECTLKDQMTLRLEGKDETFEVDADFVLSCVQDVNDFSFGTIVTSGRTVMLHSCNCRELQPGRCQYQQKHTNQPECWEPREIYCEFQHLSSAKQNVPFAAML